ncbi:MAG: hypothetical protein ACRDMV_22825 [Streptosporangiales bacterium]
MDTFVAGSGGVVSTAHDLALWPAMQSHHGVAPNGHVLLLPAVLVRESQTPQPHASGYAVGWDNSGPGITPKRVSHRGSLTRYSAQ